MAQARENQSSVPGPQGGPTGRATHRTLHGQAGQFLFLLRAHHIIDAQGQWSYGQGALLIAGDVFDRGPQQTEVLCAIYCLAQQARAVGGSAQLLLGNHESMALKGDTRYPHPKYQQVKRIGVGHTPHAEIVSLYGGRVIGIDADMMAGVRGESLLWEGGVLLRGLPDGRQLPVAAGSDDGTRRVKGSAGN